MNHFQELAATLRSYGLSDDPAHRVQDVYRSSNGKLWHLKASCGRLARSGSVTAEKADLAAPSAWSVCSTCMPRLTDQLDRYQRIARSFADIRRQLEQLQAADPTWAVLSKVETLVDQLANLLQADLADVWHTEFSLLSAAAQQHADQIRGSAFNLDALKRASAVVFIRGEQALEYTPLPEFGDPSSYSQPSRKRTVDHAWSVWKESVESGASFEAAAAAVKESVAKHLGDTPVSFAQVPQETVLKREDFSSVQAWLAMEWTLKRDANAEKISGIWQSRVENIVKAAEGKPDSLVLCALDGGSRSYYREDQQRTLIAPFAPRRLATNPSMVVVRLPHVTADWVEQQNRNGYRGSWYGRVAAEETDSPELLDVVAGLLDYNGGEMAKLETVVSVARATLS